MGERQGYGQFCPIARAAELLTTRWTPLIIRELHFGSSRYSDLRRGLPRISSALLSQRLKELEHHALVRTTPDADGPGQSYHLTEAGQALFPVLESMGHWAQAHSRDDLTRDENLDPDLLMWNIRRRVNRAEVPPGSPYVVAFRFQGVARSHSHFWLMFRDDDVEVCLRDPDHEIALTVVVAIRVMTQVWLGHLSLDQAINSGALTLDGDREHRRAFPLWFNPSLLALQAGGR